VDDDDGRFRVDSDGITLRRYSFPTTSGWSAKG
jgi:hypothetical protein